jgi:hypothetical protein
MAGGSQRLHLIIDRRFAGRSGRVRAPSSAGYGQSRETDKAERYFDRALAVARQ